MVATKSIIFFTLGAAQLSFAAPIENIPDQATQYVDKKMIPERIGIPIHQQESFEDSQVAQDFETRMIPGRIGIPVHQHEKFDDSQADKDVDKRSIRPWMDLPPSKLLELAGSQIDKRMVPGRIGIPISGFENLDLSKENSRVIHTTESSGNGKQDVDKRAINAWADIPPYKLKELANSETFAAVNERTVPGRIGIPLDGPENLDYSRMNAHVIHTAESNGNGQQDS